MTPCLQNTVACTLVSCGPYLDALWTLFAISSSDSTSVHTCECSKDHLMLHGAPVLT